MNILLIHQAFAGPNDAGGTRHFELGRHVVRKGHAFTVIASPISYLTGVRRETGHNAREEEYDGVRVLRSYVYSSLHRSYAWRVVSFVSFMFSSIWTALRAGPADLVIGTTPPIFQAVSAWIVAVLRRRPLLLEVRDLWPEFAIGMGVLRNPLLIQFSLRLERFLYRRATHILVNSPAFRDHVIKKGVPERKVTLICNGVDPEMFNPEEKGERVRKEWNADSAFIVAYAGALGAANDIPTLLRAARRLRDRSHIRFVLVGDGKERRNLQARAEEMALRNVIFAGTRSKSEMREILAASDACVAILQNIPMFATTYPNKVFDYMAAGRPTILAIDGVIRDVIEKANGGVFVPPGDDKALADAIDWISSQPDKVAAMGTAARNYVTKHFNRQAQAEQFIRLVEQFAK